MSKLPEFLEVRCGDCDLSLGPDGFLKIRVYARGGEAMLEPAEVRLLKKMLDGTLADYARQTPPPPDPIQP